MPAVTLEATAATDAEVQRQSRRQCRRERLVAAAVWLGLLGGLAAAVGIAVLLLQRQPAFYRQRIRPVADAARMRQLSARAFSKGSMLLAAMDTEAQWGERFGDAELNCWLADDFARNYRQDIPPHISQPRLALLSDRMRLGFRYDLGPIETVVHVGLRFWRPRHQDNVVVLELDYARAGAVPIPTDTVRGVFERALPVNVDVVWRRNDDALAAVLTFPSGHRDVRLLKLGIDDGFLTIQGTSSNFRLPDYSASAN